MWYLVDLELGPTWSGVGFVPLGRWYTLKRESVGCRIQLLRKYIVNDSTLYSKGWHGNFFFPLGRQSRALIGCSSFSCCAAALPSAPGRAHAPRPPVCARPGLTAIGQGVREKQEHPIKSWLMPLPVACRQMTNLEHGAAPSVRFRFEGAMHHARKVYVKLTHPGYKHTMDATSLRSRLR